MTILLDPETEAIVTQRLAKGPFSTPLEVIRAAVWAYEEEQEYSPEEIARIRELIREGEESGPAVPLDMEQILRECFQEWEEQRKAHS